MMNTTYGILLFLIPLCVARVMQRPHSPQNVGNNKKFMQKDASGRILPPTLNIRSNPPEHLRIKTGESKSLECEAGGTPPPTIHWLKDGMKIAENQYEVRHPSAILQPIEELDSELGLGFTRSRLYLDCATGADAGLYTCVAENEYLTVYDYTDVFVTDALEVDNDAICLDKKTFGSPARIQMWTHTRLEVIGTDVQLFCRPSGDPKPHVMWRGPNNKPLTDNKKYQVLQNGDLIIRKILWSDMGGYSCLTKNSEGSDEALVFLYPTMPDNDAEN